MSRDDRLMTLGEATAELYARALKRIAELEAQRKWQPIETAPKDKNVIIAVMSEGREPIVGEARYWSEHNDWWWAGNTPSDYHGGPVSDINFGEPTHWQPMPTAPDTSGSAPAASDAPASQS